MGLTKQFKFTGEGQYELEASAPIRVIGIERCGADSQCPLQFGDEFQFVIIPTGGSGYSQQWVHTTYMSYPNAPQYIYGQDMSWEYQLTLPQQQDGKIAFLYIYHGRIKSDVEAEQRARLAQMRDLIDQILVEEIKRYGLDQMTPARAEAVRRRVRAEGDGW